MLDHMGEGVRSDGPRLRLAVCGRPRLTKGLSISKSRVVGRSRKYVMTKKDEYRRSAAACLDLATRATDLTNKASLIAMAEAWLNLADKVSRLPADEPLVR